MGIPTWYIQKGIYSKLTGNATLMSIVKGIYDDVPEQTSYPYIVIGDITEAPWDTFGRKGEDQTATIHVFSKYKGYKEVWDIIGLVTDLLEKSDFIVEGYYLVGCRREFKTAYVEEDGTVRHGVIRFRIKVQQL